MSKKELENVVDEPIVDEVTYAPGEVAAHIVKEGNDYFITNLDGEHISDALVTEKTNVAFILPINPSNRKWFNVVRCDDAIAEQGFCPLTYKPTKVLGPTGSRSTSLPNAKLIAYLSEEEQAEYKAIIDRAIAARDADKKKPMSEKEKLEAKIAKAQAALEALKAQANN